MSTIKLVTKENIPILAKIFSKSFTEADPEKPWDENHSYDYLSYWINKQPDMFFGLFNDLDEPIGAMVVNIKPWRTGIRCSDGVIFVANEYQKQGLAKSLFKKVIEEAVSKHKATIFEAITFAGKVFPLTWYEKIGITPDEHAVIIKGDCVNILNTLSE